MNYEITSVPYVCLDGDVLDPITDDYEIEQDQYWSAVVGDATASHENI